MSEDKIDAFLQSPRFVVAGASTNRQKYGNKVLRSYLQNDRQAVPMNPRADEIEGVRAVGTLADLPDPTCYGLSMITPPKITEQIVDEAIRLGIRHIWMQPGAESPAAVEKAEAAGINTIHSGPCLLVVLGFRDQ